MEVRSVLQGIFQFFDIVCFDNAPRQGIGKTGTGQGGQFLVVIFLRRSACSIGAKPAFAGVGNGGDAA